MSKECAAAMVDLGGLITWGLLFVPHVFVQLCGDVGVFGYSKWGGHG